MFKSFTGQGGRDEYKNVLNKYHYFFDEDFINKLKNISWKYDDSSRENFYIRGYLIGQWYSYHTKDFLDDLTLLEIQPAINNKGKLISLREAQKTNQISFNNELNREIHKYLDEYYNPKATEFYTILNTLSINLGFNDFIEVADNLRRYKIDNLISEYDRFLEYSDSFFTEEVLKNCSKGHFNLNSIDKLDSFTVERTVSDMNFLIDRMKWSTKGIQVAWVNSRNKTGNSFCVPLKIPGEVTLVSDNKQGFQTQRHLYHEFGHGFHFNNVDEGLVYAFRRMGDHAVAEAFSALNESLLFNKHWLKSRGYNSDIAKEAYKYRVYLIRKYWAKLKTEVEFHRTLKFADNGYYTRALLEDDMSLYNLLTLDDEISAAWQLRGWLLHAQLEELIIRKYDENWFEKEETGSYIKQLFAYGYKYNADEISELLGGDLLNNKALMHQFNQHS
ncbi:hypothetical protein [Lysinibacillus sp. NPDC086135]|uniref:hypothetical protein n=1 Tax=Lysinibacillus sp. NPDC086135 TaxID=3364130 RepID=UPI003804243D